MATGNVNWEKNIAKAMGEVERRGSSRGAGSGISLPDWIPYGLCLVFGFLLADLLVNDRGIHSVNEGREYSTGGKAALLMVAEDVQSYWDSYGSLPDDVPGSLAHVLDVSYEKLADNEFRLRMPFEGAFIEFIGNEDSQVLR